MKINKSMVLTTVCIVIALVLLPSSPDLFSQSEQCKRLAAEALVKVAQVLQSKGFSLNGTTPHYGALSEGQQAGFATVLMKGNLYAFVVAGGCVATIELYIFDENKNLVGKYDGGQPFAAVVIKPDWTGKFYGIVKLRGTTQDPAVVVQLLGWKQVL